MLTGNAVRGCGTRTKGGVYLCHGLSPNGRPIEDFILDPVIEWKGKWQRGYKIVPSTNGYYNVLIFVGESFYKCLWDYVEETRILGASRKVADNFPFHMLTPGKSFMLFAHRRAYWTDTFIPPKLDRQPPLDRCKFGFSKYYTEDWVGVHSIPLEPSSICTHAHRDYSYYFYKEKELEIEGGQFTVSLPSLNYQGNVPLDGKINPKTDFNPGIFLSLLLTHIEMPVVPNVKAQNNANMAGFETYVTEY